MLHNLEQDCNGRNSNIIINPFVPDAPFLYPLKTSENITVSCFQGGRERVHWE